MVTCLACNGAGIDPLDIAPCESCQGTGLDSDLELPAGHQSSADCRCDHCRPF